MSYYQTMYGSDDLNTQFTGKDAHFGELVLRAIRDVDCPMLITAGERDAVKKALIKALDEWEERERRMSEFIMKSTSDGWSEYVGVLIRCKDCKYRKPKKTTTLNSHCVWYNRAVMADDYCSKAERKQEGQAKA